MVTKKALVHIEVAIAFGIFLVGILLMLSFFTPIQKLILHRSILNTLAQNVFNNLTTPVFVFGCDILSSGSDCDCYVVDIDDASSVCGTPLTKTNLEVISGNEVDFWVSGSNLYLDATVGNDFTVLFSCEESMSADETRSKECSVCNARISCSQPAPTLYVSYNRLKILNDSYYNDYQNVKTSLIGKANANFGIVVRDAANNELFRMMREIPKGATVASYTISETMVRQGKMQVVFFDFYIW